MSDYIERTAVHVAVDRALSKIFGDEDALESIDRVLTAIDDIPSVDLPTKVIATIEFDGDKLQDIVNNTLSRNDIVQVVRCKDCKYWHENTQFCGFFSEFNVAHRMPANAYCCCGERKDGEKHG